MTDVATDESATDESKQNEGTQVQQRRWRIRKSPSRSSCQVRFAVLLLAFTATSAMALSSQQHLDRHNEILSKMVDSNGVWRLMQESQNQTDTDIVVVDVYRSTTAVIVTSIFASVAVLFCVLPWIYLYKNRTKPPVLLGQPPFLYLICFGSMLMAIPMYFLSFDEGSTGLSVEQLGGFCVADFWLGYVGSIIVYMAMFCKLWRIFQVAQFRRNQVIKVKHVMWPLIGILVASLGVLIAMTIVQPPYWQTEAFYILDLSDPTSSTYKTYGICSQESHFATVIGFLLLGSLILAAIMSCRTRKIPPHISDGRFVCRTLWCHVLLLIVAFVLAFFGVLTGSVALFTFAQTGTQFLTVFATIGFMILPKIRQVRKGFPSVAGRVRVTGLEMNPLEGNVQSTAPTQAFATTNSEADQASEPHPSVDIEGSPRIDGSTDNVAAKELAER